MNSKLQEIQLFILVCEQAKALLEEIQVTKVQLESEWPEVAGWWCETPGRDYDYQLHNRVLPTKEAWLRWGFTKQSYTILEVVEWLSDAVMVEHSSSLHLNGMDRFCLRFDEFYLERMMT